MDLSSVRIKEHFGLISNDTHTDQFGFLVSPPKNRGSVQKYDYVLVDHPLFGEACQILGIIKDIISYEEVAGSTVGDKKGKMHATVEILGYMDLRNQDIPLQKLLVAPNPGSRVSVPLGTFLEDVLNRNLRGKRFSQPLYLGKLEASTMDEGQTFKRISCFVDAQELTTKHTLIAAMAGAGKTCIAKILIQELYNQTKTSIVIIDQAGEYINAFSNETQVTVLSANPEKVAKTINNKKTAIINLTDKNEREILSREVKPGQITILTGQELTFDDRRNFFTGCLKAIEKNRADENAGPCFLLVEEAENLSGETLNQTITEGRKNGIAHCLVSVHPSELGGRVLSQISNQIVGKTIDKDDAEYLSVMTNSGNGVLPSLTAGEWIIDGVNRSRSMKIQARELEN